jgi:hypothetical protein
LTELQSKWIKQIEDYYRDTYPLSMKKKVAEILPTGERALSALYTTVIHTVSAQYRTVPDVIAIETALCEVAEAYPELSSPPVPLLQDAGPDSDTGEWLRLWFEAMEADVDPREYEPMQEFLKSKGVLDV